jgi:hypothetical protein
MSTSMRLLSFAVLMTCAAQAQSGTTLALETHAEFYSGEVGLARTLDPQVFVVDRAAPAGVGPQAIHHAAGIRNAFVDESNSQALFNANGEPLGLTLGQWISATGTVTLSPQPDRTEKIDVGLRGLKPGARYSLFENHFGKGSTWFTPLDGSGKANSFKADSRGAATIHLVAPEALTHDNAVLVVFHSDGIAHGEERGHVGIDAHHQLIARIP